VTFDGVEERLHFDAVPNEAPGFEVRDEHGLVPIQGWELDGTTALRFRLSRPLVGVAEVTGAPGADPRGPLPFDVGTYRPMLAFSIPVRG